MSIDALDHLVLFWVGFGLGILTGVALCATYLFSLAARILGERPVGVAREWWERRKS